MRDYMRYKNKDNEIYKPPGEYFNRVDGNLNDRLIGQSIFLWFRRTNGSKRVTNPEQEADHLSRSPYFNAIEKNIKYTIRHYEDAWIESNE